MPLLGLTGRGDTHLCAFALFSALLRSPRRRDPSILEVLLSIVLASMVLQPVQVAVGFARSSTENSLIQDGVLQLPSLPHKLVNHFLFFRMFVVLLLHKGAGMNFHNDHLEGLQQIGILLHKLNNLETWAYRNRRGV